MTLQELRPLRLEHGGTLCATIDPWNGFGCTTFRQADWEILDLDGIRLKFPWLGPQASLTDAHWQVTGTGESERGAWTTARFSTDPAAPIYPFAVALQATWLLNSHGLQLETTITNRGTVHAPFGFGVRVALRSLSDLEPVQLLAPAEEVWPRNAAGQIVGLPEPVSGELDARRPRRLTTPLDALYTRRHFANLCSQAALLDPATGREVWLTTSADFRELLVAVDPHGQGALESATCAPAVAGSHGTDLHSLVQQTTWAPPQLSGVRRLAPGEAWRGSVVLVARPGAQT